MLLTIVIKPEQDCEKNGKGQGHEHFAYIDILKRDEPTPVLGRHECHTRWQNLYINPVHSSNMHEAGEEDQG